MFQTHIGLRAVRDNAGGVEAENWATPPVLHLTEPQFRALLRQLAKSAGSNAELGRRLDVSGQLIDRVLDGSRRPGPKLLSKLRASVERVYTIEVEAE